jgi:hypothetical protein
MNGDGDVNATDLGLFLQTPYACAPSGQYDENADINGDGCVNITDTGIILSLFGQTTMGAELTWDAENRLIAHTPLAPAVGDLPGETLHTPTQQQGPAWPPPWSITIPYVCPH